MPSRTRAHKPIASAPLFAALGDEKRLRLVGRLCNNGSMSISQLTSGFDISRQAITKHLRVMEAARLVRSTRNGRERVWQIDEQRLAKARRDLEMISARWDAALNRLKGFVEV
jgi:DNA-binding transcriptional ArsR family regulator